MLSFLIFNYFKSNQKKIFLLLKEQKSPLYRHSTTCMDIPKFTHFHDFSLCFASKDKTPMTLPYLHMCILITKHGDSRD